MKIAEGFRLSPQQKRLWLLQQADGGQPYRAQCALLLEGPLSVGTLRTALENVVQRHEILRTAFQSLPGMLIPVQVVTEGQTPLERTYDLTDRGAREQEDELDRLFEEAGRRRFDLENGPPLRASLVVLSPERHVLVVCAPALCADAVTLRNLAREITRSCAACPGDEANDEPLQYIDLAEWQNELLESEHAAAGKGFWRRQDGAAALSLKLPFQIPPPEGSDFDPRVFTAGSRAGVAREVEAIAGRYNSSAAVFLLACWQVLLWRLTGRPDIATAVACDGRNYEGLGEALGPFTKHPPVGSHLEKGFKFSEVLARLDECTRDAYRWQECFTPEQLAEPDGDETEPPYLPFAFEFVERPAKYSAPGLTSAIVRQYVCTERFKVKLACLERGDSLLAEFHYDPRALSADCVGHLGGQFHALVESALDNPEAFISELEILPDAERQQLLVEFNRTEAEYPADRCVHELFQLEVERRPAGVALVVEDRRLTFAELNARANKLAHHLKSLGVGPEVRVGLCVERSVEMIVGLLGILKAGGAYVPLDGEHPPARLGQHLAGARAAVLLTQERLAARMPDFAGPVLCLDADRQRWAAESEADPDSGAVPENLVYVIYTSGSTGEPKGVGVTHRNLVNYTSYLCRRIGARELSAGGGLSFATVTTLSADLGNTSIYGALLSGGCLHVISYETATDGGRMRAYMAEHSVDVLKIVPSHLNALLGAAGGADVLPRRQLILGGEAFGVELARRLDSSPRGGCKVLNHYGPTEATVGALTHMLGAGESEGEGRATVPVGKPVANAQAYVLDERMKPAPRGVVGELYLGGAGLARGYLNSAEQTAERFVPNPFSPRGGERLYRTGDRARRLLDGDIEFLGRTDHQVKINGYRIELGEIEAVLRRHGGVRQAFVLAAGDDSGSRRLVAYVIPEVKPAPAADGRARQRLDDGLLSADELQKYLKQELPAHMVPGAYVFLESLPLTVNGKVDLRALPSPDEAGAGEAEYVAPRNELESVLVNVWQEILGKAPIGIHHNYFSVGGDSIRVIQMVHELDRYGLPVTAAEVLRRPTVCELARYLHESRTGERTNSPVPLGLIGIPPQLAASLPGDAEDVYPAAMMQKFIMFHYSHDQQKAGVYHIQHSYHIHDEALNLGAFKRALEMAVRGQPALRTVFLTGHAGETFQVVRRDIGCLVTEHDLTGLSESRQEAYIDAAIEEDRAKLFDVADMSEPLFRFAVFARSQNTIEFLMSIHHAITDGWGNRAFLNQLVESYLALRRGEERTAAAPPTNTYKEFVALEREISASREAKDFWKNHLKSRPGQPLRKREPAGSQSPVSNYNLMFEPALTNRLRELSRDLRVSLKSLLLSAYLDLNAAETGEDTVTVGVVSNGRSERLSDPLKAMGLFWNIIPFCCSTAGEDRLSQVRRVQQLLIDTESYARYPLAQILEDQQATELFRATFNFLHFHNIKDLIANSGLRLLGAKAHDKFHFPLNFITAVDPTNGDLSLRVEYDRLYFGSEDINSMAGDYVNSLERLCRPRTLAGAVS
nr:condensation domain-containing protein [uncultured bacterium]